MLKAFRGLVLISLCLSIMVISASAEGQWSVQNTQVLSGDPLAVELCPVDQRLFVLLAGGTVRVFSPEGVQVEQFEVAPGAVDLTVSADCQQISVLDKQGRKLTQHAYQYLLPVEHSPIKGDVNAPVTITVFDDFQCPYCARLAPFLYQIMDAYPGKVRLVFKNFPLRNHEFAELAALAGMAAREQGKFWLMHDQLFANYNQLNEQKIKSLAEKIGLDMQQYERDIKNPVFAQQLAADMQLGREVGVRGTPSVFINGKLLRERSASGFRLTIDQELARAKR